MTFEDAIEKINDLFFEPCIPGYSTGDFAPEFSGQIEDLEEIIEELQATYAPKIEMTSEQKEEFMAFVEHPDDNFENFWFCLGSGDSLFKNKISEDDLMRAWLHPELIEVEE